MAIMVVGAFAVEADLVEEDVGDDMAADAVDAEDKVTKAEVAAVSMDKDDITETKGTNLTLIFTAS